VATAETTLPRFVAMLCILAVFIPTFFMKGAAHNLFVPLASAVGFSMVASYLLSSTFVPILSVWMLPAVSTHGRAARDFLRPAPREVRPVRASRYEPAAGRGVFLSRPSAALSSS